MVTSLGALPLPKARVTTDGWVTATFSFTANFAMCLQFASKLLSCFTGTSSRLPPNKKTINIIPTTQIHE